MPPPPERRSDSLAQRLLGRRPVRAVRKLAYGTFGLMPVSERVHARWQRRLDHRSERFEAAEAARHDLGAVRARIGVVIATYERPELCRRAVESALRQAASDIHVVVVNDGGRRPSLPDDPRLTLVELSAHTGNLGLVRNVGMRLLDGRVDLFAFLDDDNEWLPGHLDAHLRARTEPGPVLTYSAVEVVDPAGDVLRHLAEEWDAGAMRRRNHVDANSIVVTATPGLRFSRLHRANLSMRKEDWELVRRVAGHMPVRHVPEVTVRYLQNPRSYLTDHVRLHGADAPGAPGVPRTGP